jgi:hypothetical protein
VKERQNNQCARCGAAGAEHHHRMRRREGGHGKANIVYLCRTDHRWVHANPKAAQEQGYIIPIHVTEISAVPIKTFMGMMLFDDVGGASFIEEN